MNSVLECDESNFDMIIRGALHLDVLRRKMPVRDATGSRLPVMPACQLNPKTSGKTATTNSAHAEKTGR